MVALKGFTLKNGKAAYGGGIRCSGGSSPGIENCVITGNSTALNEGGGISCQSSSPAIKNCTIRGNLAFTDGGGISCLNSSSPGIENCAITDNTARFSGGGMACSNSCSPNLKNCVVAANTATGNGGGVFCASSSPNLKNCTIAQNKASLFGGGICGDNYSSLTLLNCILWGDQPQEIYGCTPAITYSDIQGGYTGTGNIKANPLFAHPARRKYYIRDDSPCFNAGTCDGAPDRDKDGNPRPWPAGGACDMGAYEYGLYPKQVRHVDPTGIAPDGSSCYQRIQTAINDTRDMDVVVVHKGTYKENINFLDKVIIVKSVDPNNPEMIVATIIDGDQKGNVVTFDHGEERGCILKGFTLQNGKATDGGGVYCLSSSPAIEKCLIRMNSGRGISCYTSSSPLINNCTISDNFGGIYCKDSSSPTIKNCLLNSNYPGTDGGGISCSSSSPSITNCSISGNSSPSFGGGIYCSSGSPSITNCTISSNSSSLSCYGCGGGGIYCSSGSPSITNCTISGNSASSYGGGIHGGGTITNCTISGNSVSSYGGGISNSGTITNCTISSNSASQGSGGGIYGSGTITNCTISGNSASYDGGGISNSGPITNCTIRQNLATGTNSTGGGIYFNSGSSTATNCIISGNSAFYGGGIYFSRSASIVHCTITNNSAVTGGGVYCSSGNPPTIKNCILWNDAPLYKEIEGTGTPTVTYSDILMGKGVYTGTGNINADPLFFNPGAEDYHLQCSPPFPYPSPCIDAGDPGCSVTKDKDGVSRPQPKGGRCDMGAYECGCTDSTPEVCDGKDNDCDGLIDEDLVQICSTSCGSGKEVCRNGKWVDCNAPAPRTYYHDVDKDGYGNASESIEACSSTPPDGYVTNKTDCNDTDKNIHPGATEVCDGKDNNCDTKIDEGVQITYYLDADGDGYGDPSASAKACTAPAGYIVNKTDCNDADPSVHPGVTEVCDGKDNDCNGSLGAGEVDADGDGVMVCKGDCDDTDPGVYPRAIEICGDGIDNDNDGLTDEGCDNCYTWQATVTATGQKSGNANRLANIAIGMSSDPSTLPSPPLTPGGYTVQMSIKDTASGQYYGTDIRSCSSEYEYWVLRVEINDDYANPNMPGYYPLLTWNPDEFTSVGYYSLYRGDQGGGTRLVADMRSVTSYQIREGDGEYFSIVWSRECSDLTLSQGWHLLSFPVLPPDPTVAKLFSSDLVISRFDPSSGLYTALDSIPVNEIFSFSHNCSNFM